MRARSTASRYVRRRVGSVFALYALSFDFMNTFSFVQVEETDERIDMEKLKRRIHFYSQIKLFKSIIFYFFRLFV